MLSSEILLTTADGTQYRTALIGAGRYEHTLY